MAGGGTARLLSMRPMVVAVLPYPGASPRIPPGLGRKETLCRLIARPLFGRLPMPYNFPCQKKTRKGTRFKAQEKINIINIIITLL